MKSNNSSEMENTFDNRLKKITERIDYITSDIKHISFGLWEPISEILQLTADVINKNKRLENYIDNLKLNSTKYNPEIIDKTESGSQDEEQLNKRNEDTNITSKQKNSTETNTIESQKNIAEINNGEDENLSSQQKESDKPEKISSNSTGNNLMKLYYTAPEEDGSFQNTNNKRKLSSDNKTVFEFILISDNMAEVRFVDNEKNQQKAINGYETYLKNIIIDVDGSFNTSAKRIIVLKNGRFELIEEKWVLKEKIKVKFI